MSKLDKLLRELCPNGVEYKKLGEIATISRGGNFQKKDFLTEGVPCIHYGQIYTKYGLFTDKTFTFISEECAKKQKMAQPNDIVMAVTSENIEDVCKCLAWLGDEPAAISGHSAIIHHNQNAKYLVYYFHSQMFFAQKRKLAHGTKVIEVTPDALVDITLPLPPIEVQREIVRMLDSYTESVVELQRQLTAELTARKAQYSHYRDKLLSYTSTAQMEKLGDTCEMKAGKAIASGLISDERTEETPIKCYGGNGVRGYVKNANENGSYPIIGRQGALCGNVKYAEGQFYATEHAVVVKPKEKYNPRFLYHLLTNMNLNQYKSAGAQPGLAVKNIAELVAPVPPLNVQNRIVNVLDNFEKICSDLNIGLPAEIEARQKQYEYYRDKLLTFAETGNTILSRAEQSRALIKLMQYVFGYVRISLGDIGSICMCKRILKSQTNTVSGVPFYKIGTFGKEADAYITQETFNEYRSKYNFPKKGDVLISAAGTIGRTVVYNGKPAYFQDSNIVWIDNNESVVLNIYLRYCYELKPWKASEGGTIPRLYNDNIAKAVIAVPSIEEQKRIVSILDRFDVICNDLTSGLPAEIEARQKQYEYYRDKLLTFKEVAAT